MTFDQLHRAVLHLPLLTTLCAIFFCAQLFSRYREKGGGPHLLWWGIGMATYGVGTLTESLTTLLGWHPLIFRSWYVSGAFLGGYPLAQGTIFLLMSRRFARRSAWIVSGFIAVASIFVFLTPLDASLAEAHRLSGRVIEWRWIRAISPFINLYSVIFLVGGAVVSALRFRRAPGLRHRYVGNVLIAVGALLPGIGGTLTRAGFVEALYVTELAGILLIYAGYRKNISGRVRSASASAPIPVERKKTMTRYGLAPILAIGLALGLLASAALAVPAEETRAEEEASDSASVPEGEGALAFFFATTTVTATGSEADVFDISTPVTVIPETEIDRQLPDSAVDLLRRQPGVDVNGVGPNQARPIIRGQRGLRVLFLENGLRMNNARRQTDFGEIPGLVDVDNLHSVEVVRGPASVLYGTDAIGGVLNLITKVPGFRDGGPLRGGAGVRYGSAGDQTRVHGDVDGRWQKFSLHLGVSVRDSDDYDAPSGRFGEIDLGSPAPVVDSGVDDDAVYGYLGYDLDDRHRLFARLNRYRADVAGFGFVEPDLLGSEEAFRIRILYPFQDFDRYTLGYQGSGLEWAAADSVEVQVYSQSNERQLANDIDINIGPIFPGAPNSSVLADTLNFTDVDTLGLRAELVKVLGERQVLTYGVEAFEDESFNTDSSLITTVLRFPFPPFEQRIPSADDVANTPNATNRSYGVFVQDEILALDRLRLTVGARYQNVETRAEPTPGWDIRGLDFDDDTIVGAVNAVYQLTPYLNLVGSYGTAFRAPNIVERLFNGPTPEGAGFQILNPDLVSERSDNFDIGLKYRRPNAIFEAVWFQNDIDDGIIQYFLTPSEVLDLPPAVQEEIRRLRPQFVVQQRNIDRLRYEGLEVIVGYRTRQGLTLGGNYTHLSGRRLDSQNPPTGDTFSDKINAYVRWEPQDGRYWLEYRVRHNADADANLDPGEPVPPVGRVLPSFTVHSLSAGVTLFERGSQEHLLAVAIDNLGDELYAEFSNATFFRPQPERNFVLSYRIRL